MASIPRPSAEAVQAVQAAAQQPSAPTEELMDRFFGGSRHALAPLSARADNEHPSTEEVLALPVDRVVPDPDQPRTIFADGPLEELADSIRTKGQIQPIVVRPGPAGTFIIVAGERRWRACTKLG